MQLTGVDVEKPHKMASVICTGRKGNMRRESKQDLNNVPVADMHDRKAQTPKHSDNSHFMFSVELTFGLDVRFCSEWAWGFFTRSSADT
nr:hypothetical protein [Tanacetum cinerariifolium]